MKLAELLGMLVKALATHGDVDVVKVCTHCGKPSSITSIVPEVRTGLRLTE